MDDDYNLSVEMSFDRSQGETQTAATITLGNDGDHLDKMLVAMTEFLNHLGFTYVAGLTAQNEDGEDVCSS